MKSKGWRKESQRHQLASRGISTKEHKPNDNEGIKKDKKIVKLVKLPSAVYSENKIKIKKMFKDEGLIFNKMEYLGNGKFVWENELERIELILEDDNSILKWESGNETNLYQNLKTYTTKIGGFWFDDKITRMTTNNDLKRFDNKYMNKFIRCERDARIKGFNHCPILIPMIKEYIEERKEIDGKHIIISDIVKKVNSNVDKNIKPKR